MVSRAISRVFLGDRFTPVNQPQPIRAHIFLRKIRNKKRRTPRSRAVSRVIPREFFMDDTFPNRTLVAHWGQKSQNRTDVAPKSRAVSRGIPRVFSGMHSRSLTRSSQLEPPATRNPKLENVRPLPDNCASRDAQLFAGACSSARVPAAHPRAATRPECRPLSLCECT